MKKFRRTIAFAAALTICMSAAVSCKDKNSTKTPQTADTVISNSYRSEEIEMPEELNSIDDMIYIEGAETVVIKGYDSDYQNVFYTTDIDFTDFTKLELDLGVNEDEENTYRIVSSDDSTMYMIITTVTYGDFETPDWNDENFDYENFDFDAYYAAAEYQYRLVHLDADGNVLESNDITADDELGTYVNNIVYCGDDKLLGEFSKDEENYVIFGTDGKVQSELDIDDSIWIDYISKASNGDIMCEYYGESGSELAAIDMDNLTLSDNKVEIDDLGNYMTRSMIKGTGDYLLYLPMNTGIYGLKEDYTTEEIVNWVDSDINGDYVNAIVALDNGDFVINEDNWETGGTTLNRITKRDSSELSDTIVVTLGMLYSDSSISSKVTEFNKTNDKYRIKIVDYSGYDVYDDESESYTSTSSGQLKNDIISGNAPDMICVNDRNVIDSLSSKGTFADLYTFMENDSELNKDMILPNILTALESDGKLYSIAPSFMISTFVAKTKFVGDKQDWTIDDMMEIYGNLSDDMDAFAYSTTSSDIFNNLLYQFMDEFVDYDSKTCSFDSDDFIELLEFCNTFPEEDEDEPDYDSMTSDEWEVYWNEQESKCRNDKALLENVYISQIREYAQYRYGDFNDEITFVGAPTSDGKGGSLLFGNSFAILNDSGCKDAAWEFIKTFFTEDAYDSFYSYQMPVVTDIFDKQAEESTEQSYYLDDNGEKQYYSSSYTVGDVTVDIPPLTEEEKDFMVDYVKNVTRVQGSYDTDLSNIIIEESDAYFAGEKTAEEAAQMIQNRASILISEKN
jgi:ABC-type glycerol-3-phosphate transport system substrate-binding protein